MLRSSLEELIIFNKEEFMKINENILSLPPYISTSWDNISSVMMKGSHLSITLKDGDSINIPGLNQEMIDLIFKIHAEQIEKKCCQNLPTKFEPLDVDKKRLAILSQSIFGEQDVQASLKFGFATFDGLNTVMQHNPSDMNAPDLPPMILEKIGAIARIIAPDETHALPKDVPHCNCFHCQITRAIHGSTFEEEEEEIVSDLELQFKEWDVQPLGNQLFNVKKIETGEEFKVFLGTPIGCNCGELNCEHIVAALRA